MSIYVYLGLVAAIAVCGAAVNRLFGESFLPRVPTEMHEFTTSTGGKYEASEMTKALALCVMLTFGAAVLVFWLIPLKSPLDRILAVASVPATGVAIYIALRFLALMLLIAFIALAGWGIYAYVK